MSKIGKVPVEIPSGVTIEIKGDVANVKGPKGELVVPISPGIIVSQETDSLSVSIERDDLENGKAFWGLTRALLNNAIKGVSEGFVKELQLVGIGYRVEKIGNNLKFAMGYSHPIEVSAPDGIQFDVEGNTELKISGHDKQLVGQIAAEIRAIRKPEPYKGKGIRYKDEIVRRKPGKTAKAAG